MPYKNRYDKNAWNRRNRLKCQAWRENWGARNPLRVAEYVRRSSELQKSKKRIKRAVNIALGLRSDGKARKPKVSEEQRREKRRQREANRHSKPGIKLNRNIRSKVWRGLRGGKVGRTMHYVGCSAEELRSYLESQFIGTMSWDNYGSLWEVDHIVPRSYFNLSNMYDVKRCWHYSNLRPLWRKKNRSRSNKVGSMTLPLGI